QPSAEAQRVETKPVPEAPKLAASPTPSAALPYAFADTSRGNATARRSSTWGSAKSLYDGSPAQSPQALSELELAPCGTGRDPRGPALAGAQVTAMHDGVRTARSGPDGAFCLESLRAGDTLTVLRVGFDPLQLVVGRETSLALEMQPVGTLPPQTTLLL